jgi:hypothetical protein
MPSHFLRICLGFNLMLMFRFHGSTHLSGCLAEWVHLQSMGEERNAYGHSTHRLLQYGSKRKCPSFCCKDFFVIFVNSGFTRMSVFISTLPSIRCQSNKMQQVSQCRRLNHNQRFRRCWSCCLPTCAAMHLVVWLQGEDLHTKTSWELTLDSDSDTHSSEDKDTAPQSDSDTDDITDKPHTVNWQYKLSTYCNGSPWAYRGSQWVTTNRGTPYH